MKKNYGTSLSSRTAWSTQRNPASEKRERERVLWGSNWTSPSWIRAAVDQPQSLWKSGLSAFLHGRLRKAPPRSCISSEWWLGREIAGTIGCLWLAQGPETSHNRAEISYCLMTMWPGHHLSIMHSSHVRGNGLRCKQACPSAGQREHTVLYST